MTPWIDASEVQTWLGGSGVMNQAEAVELALAATAAVAGYIERDVTLVSNLTETLDTTGNDYVLLRHWPIQSITSVSYNGQAVVEAAYQKPGYRIDPLNERRLNFYGMGKLPRGLMNLTVVYSAGYDPTLPAGYPAAIPGDLRQALKLTAAAIYNSQAADPNLVAESTAGVFSGSFVATGVGAVPPGARSLLARYRRVTP
jgi:hypothetical protein